MRRVVVGAVFVIVTDRAVGRVVFGKNTIKDCPNQRMAHVPISYTFSIKLLKGGLSKKSTDKRRSLVEEFPDCFP